MWIRLSLAASRTDNVTDSHRNILISLFIMVLIGQAADAAPLFGSHEGLAVTKQQLAQFLKLWRQSRISGYILEDREAAGIDVILPVLIEAYKSPLSHRDGYKATSEVQSVGYTASVQRLALLLRSRVAEFFDHGTEYEASVRNRQRRQSGLPPGETLPTDGGDGGGDIGLNNTTSATTEEDVANTTAEPEVETETETETPSYPLSNDTASSENSSGTPSTMSGVSTTTATTLRMPVGTDLNISRTTVVVVNTTDEDDIHLAVVEFFAIVCSVFIAGIVIGGLIVYLMTTRRRNRRSAGNSNETISNPIADQTDHAAVRRHPSLRPLPSAVSAITQRFQRAGFEEGFFVPDEGWAVITSNTAVQASDVTTTHNESAATADVDTTRHVVGVCRDSGSMSAARDQSPPPSDASLHALEHKESFRRTTSGPQELRRVLRRQSDSVPPKPVEGSVAGSVSEDPADAAGQYSCQRRSTSHTGRSYSLPDTGVRELCATSHLQVKPPIAHGGSNVDDDDADFETRRESVLKPCGQQRVSSKDRLDSMYNDLFAEDSAEPPLCDPMSPHSLAVHRDTADAQEIQSEPISPSCPAGKAEATNLSSSLTGQELKAFSYGDAGNNAMPLENPSQSHVSAPPSLLRKPLSDPVHARSPFHEGRGLQRDANRLSPMYRDRLLSWIESQDSLHQGDFELHPSSAAGASTTHSLPQPEDLPAMERRRAQSSSSRTANMPARYRFSAHDAGGIQRTASHRAVASSLGSAWESRPLMRASAHSSLALFDPLRSASTGVLFPDVTQTFESIVHPLASPPSHGECLSASSHNSANGNGQLVAAAASRSPVASLIRPRASFSLATPQAQQRLSMHPVDVIEMDLVGEDVPMSKSPASAAHRHGD